MIEIESSNKIWLGIMVVMVDKDAHVLMGKRKNAFAAGEYSLPGGHVEAGEQFQKAAVREIEEETTVIVKTKNLHLIAITNYIEPTWDRQYITFEFYVDQWKGKIQTGEPNKCEGWEWYDLDNLPSPRHYPANRVIEHYKQWSQDHNVVLD